MKLKKGQIIFAALFILFSFVFVGCKKAYTGENLKLQTEDEAKIAKSKNMYSLDIRDDRLELVTPVADLNKIEYLKKLIIGIKQDEKTILKSLLVNGEERVQDVVDNKLSLTMKNDTTIFPIFEKKKYQISINQKDRKYLRLLSDAEVKVDDYCEFELYNTDPKYLYDVMATNADITRVAENKYKFQVSQNHEISLKKTANFQDVKLSLADWRKTAEKLYEYIKEISSGVFFKASDLNFADGFKINDSAVEYQSENNDAYAFNTVLKEIINKEYSFTFDFEKVFSKDKYPNLEIENKSDKLIFKLTYLDEYNQEKTKRYEMSFRMKYKNEKGDQIVEPLKLKDGFWSFSTVKKTDISLEFVIEEL